VIAATRDKSEYERLLTWCIDQDAWKHVTSSSEGAFRVLQIERPSEDTLLVRFAIEIADSALWRFWVRD